MQFEESFIYHIFNQGNNRKKIFFNKENYLFFLKKIKTHITPYADILAWCLMPNHFHLMVSVNHTELVLASDTMTSSHRITNRTLNNSVAIMLRSYTRAVNKEKGLSGSLFRAHTKAECLNCTKGFTPSFIIKNGVTHLKPENPEKEYPQICFQYIHQNPVKARLVSEETHWEYSSARDYAGLRDGKLVNKKLAETFGLQQVIR